MAMQRTLFGCAKSIAGTGFIALGSFVSYENVSHLRNTVRGEGPGVLPNLILTASQILHAYRVDHQRFVQIFLLDVLTLFWPLLLAIIGTILSRDFFTDNVNSLSKKGCGRVDLSASRSTSE